MTDNQRQVQAMLKSASQLAHGSKCLKHRNGFKPIHSIINNSFAHVFTAPAQFARVTCLTVLMASPAITIAHSEFPEKSDFTEEKPTAEVEKPDFMEAYIDPVFKTRVRRITDRENQGIKNRHPYPKRQAWNWDQSLLMLGYRILDANTFEEIDLTKGLHDDDADDKLGSREDAAIRWSNTDPDVLYVAGRDEKLRKVTINESRTDTDIEVMHDFSGKGYVSLSIGNGEGNIDNNDKYVVLVGRKANTDRVFPILYDLQENHVVWGNNDETVLERGRWRDKGDPNYSEEYFDWITVSPKGDYILVNAENNLYQYDINLENEYHVSKAQHGDIGIDANGEQVYVQFEFKSTEGEEGEIGTRIGIWGYNLKNRTATRLLTSKYNGGHVSCRNYLRPGRCYVSTQLEGYREVIALDLDNDSFNMARRYAQTHISDRHPDPARKRNSHVSVSPDGNQLLFASDWGNINIDAIKMDTYHVSYPHIDTWRTSYLARGNIWINLKGGHGNEQDWIGIYPAEASNDWGNQVAWRWAADTTFSGHFSDWFRFQHLDPGKYEARFFLNNSFDLHDKVEFEVTIDLRTWKPEYASGDNIWIRLIDTKLGEEDWIGIYPADASNDWSNQVAWRWAKDMTYPGYWYRFQSLPPGRYEARFFRDNSFELEDSVSFRVLN